jgi:hypothetical protein
LKNANYKEIKLIYQNEQELYAESSVIIDALLKYFNGSTVLLAEIWIILENNPEVITAVKNLIPADVLVERYCNSTDTNRLKAFYARHIEHINYICESFDKKDNTNFEIVNYAFNMPTQILLGNCEDIRSRSGELTDCIIEYFAECEILHTPHAFAKKNVVVTYNSRDHPLQETIDKFCSKTDKKRIADYLAEQYLIIKNNVSGYSYTDLV